MLLLLSSFWGFSFDIFTAQPTYLICFDHIYLPQRWLPAAFITSFFAGLVPRPKHLPCMWLYAFPQAVWFCGGLLSSRSVWCSGRSFHPAILIVRAEQPTSHIVLCWACLEPQTTSLHVVVCFPTGRLILRGLLSQVLIVWAEQLPSPIVL